MTGRLADIRRLCVHDGPGIRTTLFLKGCPLRCRWCHNPEALSPEPEIGLLRRKCVACGRCAAVCPVGAHVVRGATHTFNREHCTVCGACVKACLPNALEYYGREVSADEAVQAVLEDRTFYAQSGGGATLSGGEPLAQAAFCAEVCERLRATRVHCAIDTSGAVPWSSFEAVLPHVDLFLYDVKHADDRRHREGTGVANAPILENLRHLTASGARIEVRLVLIPGYNDADADLRAVGELLAGLAPVPTLRLLPYHALARPKYEAVGRPDTLPNVPPPEAAARAHAAAVLRRAGAATVVTP